MKGTYLFAYFPAVYCGHLTLGDFCSILPWQILLFYYDAIFNKRRILQHFLPNGYCYLRRSFILSAPLLILTDFATIL